MGTQPIFIALSYDLNRVQVIRDSMRRAIIEGHNSQRALPRGTLALYIMERNETQELCIDSRGVNQAHYHKQIPFYLK